MNNIKTIGQVCRNTAGWYSLRVSVTRTSVRQTLPSVGLCPEQAAVGVLGRVEVQCCERGLQLPGAPQGWQAGWGKSHSQSPWEAAGTEWSLAGLWRLDPVSLVAWESPVEMDLENKKKNDLGNYALRLLICEMIRTSVTSMGWRWSKVRSNVIPKKKVWRLKRSRVFRRREGLLHRS